MLKLINNKPTDIAVTEMKDGDLAVITVWNGSTKAVYVGLIVHRYKDILIPIGKRSGASWSMLFDNVEKHEDCRVRLLEKGEILVVE